MPVISGEVRDSGGALESGVVVRAYRRSDGKLIGETTSSDGTGVSDTHYSNVSLLVHCDGENGSTLFTDYSPLANVITCPPGVFQASARKVLGQNTMTSSLNGIGLTTPGNNGFSFGTGDFTVEAMIYIPSYSYFGIMSNNGPSNQGFYLFYDDYAFFQFNAAGVTIKSTSAFGQLAWYHIAISRSSGVIRMFVNGGLQGSAISSVAVNSTAVMNIGRYSGWGVNFSNQAEHRITKGVGRYTANFVPPSEPHPDYRSSVPFGEYKIIAPEIGEAQIICLSKDSGGIIRNDLVHRTIVV